MDMTEEIPSTGRLGPAPLATEDEAMLVLGWRLERLARIGFAGDLLTAVALADVDIAAAERLVGRGCPFETAARILL